MSEQLNNFERSHLITFFDLFAKHDDSHQDIDSNCKFSLYKLNHFEGNFLNERLAVLNTLLKTFELNIEYQEEKTIPIIYLTKEGQKISNKELNELIERLEKQLEQNKFDFPLIARKITQVCKEILENNFEYIKGMQETYVYESAPFNEEWSAYFDIAFQTGAADHKMTIVYPNPSNFNEYQVKAASDYSWKTNRLQRDYLHRFYRAFPHELIHCVQSHVKQVDPFPVSWSAEHDASYLCGSLTFQLFKFIRSSPSSSFENLNQWFYDGLYEELLVAWLDEIVSNQEKVPDFNPLYQTWKNQFGLVKEFVEIPPGGSYVLKDRIPFEVLSESDGVFKAQVDFCLKDRSGDVYQYVRDIPDICKVQSGRNIEEVKLPISPSSPLVLSLIQKFK